MLSLVFGLLLLFEMKEVADGKLCSVLKRNVGEKGNEESVVYAGQKKCVDLGERKLLFFFLNETTMCMVKGKLSM